MKDINLYSEKKEKKESNNGKVTIVASLVIFITVAIGGAFAYLNFLSDDCEEKTTTMETKISSFSTLVKTKKSIEKYNQKIQRTSEVMESISNKSIINTMLLQKMSQVMPENVFLLSYSAEKNNQLKLVGKSRDKDSIAYFIQKLEDLKVFKDIKIRNITSDSKENSEGDSQGASQGTDVFIEKNGAYKFAIEANAK